ncbi:hypothetical protein HYDPIDRAFT_43649 [Hydnomerulius pinastri MD-312]|uniref:Uncharacterized protein n=1 Tax=Hydnomerulius pinastri MD-312 TaxID=994086 RepID=A0A0C9WA35_9AGAM|nr:hypothetical protein HYDPIDRAFT_43649 [Hydnomerulius pinastri MD-312]
MGLVIGGYILELSRAKEWADKRWPGAIKWRSEECTVHSDIKRHLNSLYHPKEDGSVSDDYHRCLVIPWQQDAWLFFPTAWRRDPSFTRQKHKVFRENDYARSLKADWFEPLYEELPHLKDIRFATSYDPFRTGV